MIHVQEQSILCQPEPLKNSWRNYLGFRDTQIFNNNGPTEGIQPTFLDSGHNPNLTDVAKPLWGIEWITGMRHHSTSPSAYF